MPICPFCQNSIDELRFGGTKKVHGVAYLLGDRLEFEPEEDENYSSSLNKESLVFCCPRCDEELFYDIGEVIIFLMQGAVNI